MIRYLIDSDSAIFATSGVYPAMRARLEACAPREIAISAVSYAEIAIGTHAGKPPSHEVLESFIRAIPIVDFDEPAARAYASLPFKRARFDRLLAAHALSIDATIITNNEADFADVPGLKTENWTL